MVAMSRPLRAFGNPFAILHVAANFEFRLPPGRLGPDFWPKLILGLLLLACFAYVGRYRRHWVIWLTSILGSIALMFLFMRVVYISLPIGVAPFSAVSLAAMKLMGIS